MATLPPEKCDVQRQRDGRLAVRLSPDAVSFPFVDFAQALVDECQGTVTARLGTLGGDEVFWDIEIAGTVLTLEHQHFLGVFLRSSDSPSEQKLQELIPFIDRYLAARRTGGVIANARRWWRRLRALSR